MKIKQILAGLLAAYLLTGCTISWGAPERYMVFVENASMQHLTVSTSEQNYSILARTSKVILDTKERALLTTPDFLKVKADNCQFKLTANAIDLIKKQVNRWSVIEISDDILRKGCANRA